MSETAAPTSAAAAPAPAPETATATAPSATTGDASVEQTPPPSKTTVAGLKDNATASSASKDNVTAKDSKPSVIEQVKRYIPGLGAKDEPKATSKRKKSGKKTGTPATASSVDVAHAKDPALATATLETAPSRDELPKELQAGSRPRIAGLNGTPAEEESDAKKFSAAAYVQKRLRANNKKIQKLQSYETQTSPLNEDQKKSLQQKPVLEAIQRELGEISKAFEAEEADEAKKAEKQKKADEQRIQQRVAAAVSDQKLNNQNELALLLQFLHLYSLFNPGQSSQYSQSAVPPVVANATALQHRAVHELFQNLANGPLVGSGDDAVSHIENLRSGSSKSVIEGVSFADVKQMILDLTAGPAEMGHELPASEVPGSVTEHAAPSVAGADVASSAPGLNFMQASELEAGSAAPGHSHASEIPVHPVKTEIGSNAATPGFGNTPAVEKTEAAATQNGFTGSTPLSPDTLPKTEVAGWESTDPVKSWADEVEESNPADPLTTTPALPADATEQQAASGPITDSDGFVANRRGGRGGSARGDYRGGRGSGRGRGGPRGSRGGASGEYQRREGEYPRREGEYQRREPRGDGHTGEGGDRRGSFRGRGRGEGRGEFRGGRGSGGRGRGQSSIPTTASAQEA